MPNATNFSGYLPYNSYNSRYCVLNSVHGCVLYTYLRIVKQKQKSQNPYVLFTLGVAIANLIRTTFNRAGDHPNIITHA